MQLFSLFFINMSFFFFFFFFLHFIAKVTFLFYFIQVTQQVFVAEEWVKNARGETRLTQDARAKVEVQLGALKEKQAKMTEQLKDAIRAKDSAEAGLKTTKRQFKEIRKELHYSKINLPTEKQMVTELRE